MNNLSSKMTSYVIFGLGQSGLSCARYFDRIGRSYYLIDTRERPPGFDKVNQLSHCAGSTFGNIKRSILDNFEIMVLSPGIDPRSELVVEAKKRKMEIVGDIDIFARQCRRQIVAITGSNGKSTVTDLTERLIRSANKSVQKGGNIGLPVLDFLPQDSAEIYVLELSSFQLDSTDSLCADVAVLLNISEDHMDRYESFNDYALSKKQIFNRASVRIFNADDKLTVPNNTTEKDLCFSLSAHNCFDIGISPSSGTEGKVLSSEQQCVSQSHLAACEQGYQLVVNGRNIVSTSELLVTGTHNWMNALVSLSILDRLNISIDEAVIEELRNYRGLEHRFQLVSTKRDCQWINDSKATNVGATIAALQSLDSKSGRVFLIAGGDSKNADLSELKPYLESKVDFMILFGQDANKIGAVAPSIPKYYVETLSQAVKKIGFLMKSGDTILLSPACASLDMFTNFQERGKAFVSAIEECA
ncbi:MAG: UDP-N-acetylmuramoyl-L-alanine--D-glutamate ligase [Kangiellaceae bacterium]|nr:UDP-N-acetylmuramoyl-L-alanine--D-glutamate ligase [Kangiellaceae bacterium]